MRRTIVLVALSAIVSHSLARSTFPVLLPAIEEDLLTSYQQAGLLTGANFAAYLAGVALVSTISGRFEPVRLLQIGLATGGLGFVLLASAPGVGMLLAGQVLAGLGSAGVWMSAPVIATASVPANRRGLVMGILSSVMGLGIVTVSQGTNAIRSIRADQGLWRPTWWAGAVFTATILALITVTLRLPPTERIKGGISLNRLRSVPHWFPLTVAYWLFGFVVASFTPFLGATLEEKGFERAHVGHLYALLGLAAAVGAATLGRVSDRVGRAPVLVGSMGAIGVSCLLVVVGREPFAAIAAAAFGVASFTYPVLTTAYLSDHIQGRAMTNALGALTLIYGTGLASAPTIMGTVGDSSLGFDTVFVTQAVLAVVAMAVVSRLPSRAAG